jgi:PAS domain S-box-containing protein
MRSLIGCSQNDLPGINFRQYMDRNNGEKLYQVFQECLQTGRPVKIFGYELIPKNRPRCFIEGSVFIIKNSNGSPVGFRGIIRDITEKKGAENSLIEYHKRLQDAQLAAMLSLARLVEYRDNNAGRHLERIRELSRILAQEMAKQPEYNDYITGEYIEDIDRASILHDIGKVGIPDAILLKPGGLTPEEFETIKQHPVIGGDALRAAESKIKGRSFLTLGREIAYYHHEKWDGGGYPRGLSGSQIPLSARLVALSDVYDALTSERIYKKAFSHTKARDIILRGQGTQFDPDIVQAFVNREYDFNRVRIELRGQGN